MRPSAGAVLVLALLAALAVAGAAAGLGHRDADRVAETYETGWSDDLLEDPNRTVRVQVGAEVSWYWANLTLTTWSDRDRVHGETVNPHLEAGSLAVAYRYPTISGVVEGKRNLSSDGLLLGPTLEADLPRNRSLDVTVDLNLSASVEDRWAGAGLELGVGNLTWTRPFSDAGGVKVSVPAGTPIGAAAGLNLSTAARSHVEATLEGPPANGTASGSARLSPVDGASQIRVAHRVGNRPPALEVAQPPEGSAYQGSVPVRGTVSDPDGERVTVTVRAEAEDKIWVHDDPFTEGTWSTSLDVAEASPGNLSVRVEASDGLADPPTVWRNVTMRAPPEEPADGGAGDGGGGGVPTAGAVATLGAVVGAAWARRGRR